MFALFMDYVVRPALWVTSRRFRDHQRYVRTQNSHLSGRLHTTADATCGYCRARSTDLLSLGRITEDDPRVLP